MRKSLAAAASALSVVILLVMGDGAGAKQFTVQTCTTEDRHAPLGPTIAAPNLLSWSGAAPVATNDRCAVGDRFTFQTYPGLPMGSGDSIVARWTAAPGTLLGRL